MPVPIPRMAKTEPLNVPQCTAPWLPRHVDRVVFFILQICFSSPSVIAETQSQKKATGQCCIISSGAINHRYADEKSNLFKHDSIKSLGWVSISSSGKYHRHRIINEKFKNYFWSFPTRLENLKPNLREEFHNLENIFFF